MPVRANEPKYCVGANRRVRPFSSFRWVFGRRLSLYKITIESMVILALPPYIEGVIIYMSISQKQLLANQANAQKSTGPKTATRSLQKNTKMKKRTPPLINQNEERNPLEMGKRTHFADLSSDHPIHSPATNKQEINTALERIQNFGKQSQISHLIVVYALGRISVGFVPLSAPFKKCYHVKRQGIRLTSQRIDMRQLVGWARDSRSRYNWPISAPRMNIIEE
ncbi:MAG: hypothetical protein NT002_11325 [candidate division Zixibacteria bacterium]|nr:hypothetical protein [candidate division Zixibacteria bacterium]